MDLKVDWLSFTVPFAAMPEGWGGDTLNTVLEVVKAFTNGLLIPVAFPHRWEVNKGAGFYESIVVDKDTKMRLSWGRVNPHIYCEINGVACDEIRAGGTFQELLHTVGFRASRVDIAGDSECQLEPGEVIGNFYNATRLSHSHIVSADGETVYVGSRKSERFLRVYRYRHPHPRAHLLRVEHELKGDLAKVVCQQLTERGVETVFNGLNQSYHWDNAPFLEESHTTGKISAKRSDRESASTILWVLDTVCPSLVRLEREKLLNIREVLQKHVFDLLD